MNNENSVCAGPPTSSSSENSENEVVLELDFDESEFDEEIGFMETSPCESPAVTDLGKR